WYFLSNVTKPGISLRHGGHQVAQKSKITTFPLKSARLIGSPLISRSCQLGATGFGSAAGEVFAASKTAIERTAKRRFDVVPKHWVVLAGFCLRSSWKTVLFHQNRPRIFFQSARDRAIGWQPSRSKARR